MSSQLRFRSGQVHLRRLRVDADTVIQAGDLVYLDDDDVKPASAFPWDTDLATTQAAFAALFLGVAHHPSAAGSTADISVDISPTAVYEFDASPAAYEVGDLLGLDELDSTLMSRQVEAVGDVGLAIARAAEYQPAGSSKLRVTFASAFCTMSTNVNAAIG